MIILGTNSIKDTGYDVANSAIWNRADSAYMDRTFSSAGNRDKWTYSLWVKKCKNGVEQRLLTTSDNATFDDNIRFNSDDTFTIICNNAVVLKTNRVFRDPSAWLHICVIWDSGNSTSGDRCQLFVNGTRETSFSTESYPSQNQDSFINNNTRHYIGVTNVTANSHFFDGYLTEIVFQNDSADSPVDKFGEFDEDTPTIFKPINVSGLTFGTNGFYLDFEDSSALGNDVSGNNNDFSLTNFAATDQNTDTCTNNACTLNPLFPNSGLTFSEGNLNVVASDANYRHAVSSMAVQSGKWYAEFKAVSGFSSVDKNVGIYRTDNVYSATTGLGNYTTGTTWCYGATGNVRTNNSNNDTGEATFTNGDIISIAMDLDNNKLYFAKNNSWINSGDPTSGSTGTGAYAIVAGNFYHFAVTTISSGGAALWSCNFGSPAYSVSSPQSDANGFGSFSYAPPSGYLSLCSKNLGSDGG